MELLAPVAVLLVSVNDFVKMGGVRGLTWRGYPVAGGRRPRREASSKRRPAAGGVHVQGPGRRDPVSMFRAPDPASRLPLPGPLWPLPVRSGAFSGFWLRVGAARVAGLRLQGAGRGLVGYGGRSNRRRAERWREEGGRREKRARNAPVPADRLWFWVLWFGRGEFANEFM